MRIAVDAMGGDHAPAATVAGAVAAARELAVGVLLVGDRARVEKELARHATSGLDLEIRHAESVIEMHESPLAALKRSDSSMSVSFDAACEREVAGVVFAGNTGAGVLLGAQRMGCCPGVDRPAIAALLPRRLGQTVLLDAGANVDCRPFHLAQFAVMGDCYARALGEIDSPRLGLLSNGVESGKGDALTRATAPLIGQLAMNFVGYVEGRDVLSGKIDVAVCDGFVGNVLLKGFEGCSRMVGEKLGDAFRSSLRGRLAYLLARPALESVRRELDASETGGALLLGLNGVVVKAHGASDARAVRNAVALAARLVRSDVTRKMSEGMAATAAFEGAPEPRRARRFWDSIRGRLKRDPRAGGSGDDIPAPGEQPATESRAPATSGSAKPGDGSR